MKTKILILAVLTGIIFTACTKYPEGGSYILANMERKVSGIYHFEHYYVDGIDSVDYYFRKNIKNNNFETYIEFLNSPSGESEGIYLPFNKPDYYFFYTGNWFVSDDKRYINMVFGSLLGFDTVLTIYPLTTMSKWEILKLKDGDLFLETNYNGKHYRLELK